jgi:hypothetical protein
MLPVVYPRGAPRCVCDVKVKGALSLVLATAQRYTLDAIAAVQL